MGVERASHWQDASSIIAGAEEGGKQGTEFSHVDLQSPIRDHRQAPKFKETP